MEAVEEERVREGKETVDSLDPEMQMAPPFWEAEQEEKVEEEMVRIDVLPLTVAYIAPPLPEVHEQLVKEREERVRVVEREVREKTLPFPLWRLMLENDVEVNDGDWQLVVEREMSGALVSVMESIETDVQTRLPTPTLSKDVERVAVVVVE